MKKSSLLFIALVLTLGTVFSQVPAGIKYQTIIRDSSGAPLVNQAVTITLSILQGDVNGTSVCTEIFNTATNEFGLANLVIGSVDTASFQSISWAEGPYFVKVEVNGLLIGTSQLLSVPYALFADRSNASYWDKSGANIYYNNGFVGLGVTEPSSRLTLDDGEITLGDNPYAAGMTYGGIRAVYNNDTNYGIAASIDFRRPAIQMNGNEGEILFRTNYGATSGVGELKTRLVIGRNGNIGINDDDPISNLSIGVTNATDVETDMLVAEISNTKVAGVHHLRQNDYTGLSALVFKTTWGSDYTEKMRITYNGFVGIGTSTPTAKLEVVGYTKTQVLEITGGSDLAEPFPVTETLQPGAVVVIDESNPGHLIQSTLPYDKRVAGIVSGAGGIQPGLTLKQEGVMEGTVNVALSGRVYVLATTENGSIKPGDLLTTSGIPGHAMKAIDQELVFGAVIGKAMSELIDGEGLVLILVNLQ